ncbi:MAG TPA: PilT/PilU family type 4a pilus ATPase [Acidimicrobiia bacterium]|nr:PilT/PilU family type 4a pilus ATPase [Acidimicrobiia bacterium]
MAVDQLTRQLAQQLIDENLVVGEVLAETTKRAAATGSNPVVGLIQTGAVRRTDLLRIIAERIGIEFYDPTAGSPPDPTVLSRLEPSVAVSESALPLRIEGGVLVVAMAEPLDTERRRRLAAAAHGEIAVALAPRDSLDDVVRRTYLTAPRSAVPSPGTQQLHAVMDGPPVPAAPQGDGEGEAGFHLNDLLETLLENNGSDLHLSAGLPPLMRVNGELVPIEGYGKLMPGPLRALVYGILTAHQREDFENDLELDASHPVPGRGRFRVSVFFQRGAVGAVMRAIPNEVMSLSDLGMPPIVREFAYLPRGLVLVTGATGSGKSTTLASIVDEINTNRGVHVMTVEDPIEFMHRHKKSIVNQREVGADTVSFATALRHALRQDPDVILVGEMRDLETMSTTLTAAETGHLVFATLHTQDAPGSIERIIDVFPPHQQQQVRVQLAESLQGVVTQQLLPTVDGKARVAAVEVMVAIPAIRNLIREGKTHQIRSTMQAGGRHGMQTMDKALAGLVKAGKVDMKLATERAQNAEELMNLLGGQGR